MHVYIRHQFFSKVNCKTPLSYLSIQSQIRNTNALICIFGLAPNERLVSLEGSDHEGAGFHSWSGRRLTFPAGISGHLVWTRSSLEISITKIWYTSKFANVDNHTYLSHHSRVWSDAIISFPIIEWSQELSSWYPWRSRQRGKRVQDIKLIHPLQSSIDHCKMMQIHQEFRAEIWKWALRLLTSKRHIVMEPIGKVGQIGSIVLRANIVERHWNCNRTALFNWGSKGNSKEQERRDHQGSSSSLADPMETLLAIPPYLWVGRWRQSWVLEDLI